MSAEQNVSSVPVEELVRRVREAMAVDWYGPNPEYRPKMEAGHAALDDLARLLGVESTKARGAKHDNL